MSLWEDFVVRERSFGNAMLKAIFKERMNFILFKKVVRIGIAWFVTLLLVSFRRFQIVVLFFVYSVLFYLPR